MLGAIVCNINFIKDMERDRELALKLAIKEGYDNVEYIGIWNNWSAFEASHTYKLLYIANIPFIVLVKDGIAKEAEIGDIDDDYFEECMRANPLYEPNSFSKSHQ